MKNRFEWTKALCNIANPCSKLLCTEVREVYQILRNQTLDLNDSVIQFECVNSLTSLPVLYS